MNDNNLYFGEYRPTTCEWEIQKNIKCSHLAHRGKAYCKLHYEQSFRRVSDNELDDEVEHELKSLLTSEFTTNAILPT